VRGHDSAVEDVAGYVSTTIIRVLNHTPF